MARSRRLFSAAWTAAGYEPRIVFRVSDCEMFQALVAAGMGIGFLPRLALHPVHPGVSASQSPMPRRAGCSP